jgi:hypothetical protein
MFDSVVIKLGHDACLRHCLDVVVSGEPSWPSCLQDKGILHFDPDLKIDPFFDPKIFVFVLLFVDLIPK